MGYTETVRQAMRRDELAAQGLTCSNATAAGPMCRNRARHSITVTVSDPEQGVKAHDITLQYCEAHWKELGRLLGGRKAVKWDPKTKCATTTNPHCGQVCVYNLGTIKEL